MPTLPAAALASTVLAYDKVAGVSTAVFGLTPQAQQNAALFSLSVAPTGAANATTPPPLLVAITKLSQIVTARYAPTAKWRSVWSLVLCSVGAFAADACAGEGAGELFPEWTPLVTPFASPTAKLPADAGLGAVGRAVGWLASNSGLLSSGNATCPAPFAEPGAAITCMLEGFSSKIDWNGTQQLASDVRMDCNAESAMALALGSVLGVGADGKRQRGEAREVPSQLATQAAGLLDYVYFQSLAQQGMRANASNPAYGLVAWGVSSPAWLGCTYGDDDARVLLASITASAALNSSRWDESILKAMLANLHTSSRYGFRPGRIDFPDLEAKGWAYYFDSDMMCECAHPRHPLLSWGPQHCVVLTVA